MGEKNKSLEVTNKILKIDHKLTGVYRLISSMTSFKTDSSLISTIEELLENRKLENWQKADLYFSLSKGFDDLGDYKKSFEYCQKGNMLKDQIWNTIFQKIENFFQVLKNVSKILSSINFQSLNMK